MRIRTFSFGLFLEKRFEREKIIKPIVPTIRVLYETADRSPLSGRASRARLLSRERRDVRPFLIRRRRRSSIRIIIIVSARSQPIDVGHELDNFR